MAEPVIIGLDAGTSVIKAVAFDTSGREIGKAARKNALQYVEGGGVEQDLHETWRAARETLRELSESMPGLSDRVIAVAITGQGDGTWLIDAQGEPVGPAMLWLDARSSALVADWRDSDVGRSTYGITGTGLNQSMQSGQLRWLRDNRPERLDAAATAFHCKDWLYFRMTGCRVTDGTEAVWTFGNYRTGDYDDSVLSAFGLSRYRHLLPEIVDGSRSHDPLTAKAAAATGLKAGTPVVLAPVDMQTTALGGGVFDPDRRVACSVIGSTGAHLCVRHRPEDVVLRDQAGYTMPFVEPGTRMQLVSNMAATLNIDWFVEGINALLQAVGQPTCSHGELLSRLDAALARVPPGRVIYHPFISASGERGPFVNPWARAQFLGLSTEVTQLDMARAVYEGIAFAARDCYSALEAAPGEVRVTGGAAQSATLRGILAAALGVPIRTLHREETGAAGAAMVATLSLGLHGDLAAACQRWVTPYLDDPVRPDTALADVYDRLFPVYRQAYSHSAEFWRGFHAVGGGDGTPTTDGAEPGTRQQESEQ